MNTYGLDAAHYLTSPSMGQSAVLKITKIEIDLLHDQDMHLFFEEGIRGGVSVISNRYAKANNKYMGEEYDESKDSSYIMYWDANALYSGAMQEPVPYKNFRWIETKTLRRMEKYPSLIKSCTLEVDLNVPNTKEFHKLTNDCPLAPETKLIEKVQKLAPNLLNKKRYIVHHKALRCYLKYGLVLKKIHRGVSYEEKAFMKPYIDLNTKMRIEARNDFEVMFFKLMNNSVFGKQMENVRQRSGVKVISAESEKGKKRLRKLICNPGYKSTKIFPNSGGLVSVNMAKKEVKLDKPISVGQAILDFSKVTMFEFLYGYVKPKWADNASLLMTDADSFVFELKTEDVYKDISSDVCERFDTSNYKGKHPSGMPTGVNKKVPGMFKDEMSGEIITEFVGLRAKMYATRSLDGKEEKKAKGVPKSVVKKSIHFDHYKNRLFGKKTLFTQFYGLRSRDHNIHTERVTKVALSGEDTKRYLLHDGSHKTLAWGNLNIPKGHEIVE